MPAPLCAEISEVRARGRAIAFLIALFAGEMGFEFDKALLEPHLHTWLYLSCQHFLLFVLSKLFGIFFFFIQLHFL